MKNARQELILDIISKYKIETQEELLVKLNESGCSITQATVSRDIRKMKLIKTMDESGSYRYAASAGKNPEAFAEGDGSAVYNMALSGSVRSVDCAVNDVVIKTYPGMASAVAAAVDNQSDSGILGCIAGDDTVIVILRSAEKASEFARKLTEASRK